MLTDQQTTRCVFRNSNRKGEAHFRTMVENFSLVQGASQRPINLERVVPCQEHIGCTGYDVIIG